MKARKEKKKKTNNVIKKCYLSPTYEKTNVENSNEYRKRFPEKFPFWARLKINKNRTTLVIDSTEVLDRKNNIVPGFVHRESIHYNNSGRNYENRSESRSHW